MRLSDAEWKVMREVWRLGEATARDVASALASETGWAYNTVKTMMVRLEAKGALRSRMGGKTSFYQAALTRRRARRAALRALVDVAFDGGFGPLVRFLLDEEALSAKDRAALRRLAGKEGAGRRRAR
jgi:predicted transcriptional regulator